MNNNAKEIFTGSFLNLNSEEKFEHFRTQLTYSWRKMSVRTTVIPRILNFRWISYTSYKCYK